MKICVLPPDKHVPLLDHISSGQERVARDQAIILAEAGHKVDYWTVETNSDLSPLGFNHRIIPNVKARACFESTNAQLTPKRAWAQARALQYDMILAHVDSSSFLKELVKPGAGPRILSFIHTPQAGTFWGDGFISGQGRAKWAGATVATVSTRCQDHWNKWCASTRERLKMGTFPDHRPDLVNLETAQSPLITEVLCPQFSVLTSPVKPVTIGPLVLSRLDKAKSIHRAFNTGTTFVVRTDDLSYQTTIQDQLDQETVFLDKPHLTCMELLSAASVLISTWTEETSGINAFEAAERGVPVILCENGIPHASRDFLPDWAYRVCKPSEVGVREALANMPAEWSTLAFRKRLAAHMRTQWSKEVYAKKLLKLVNAVAKDAKLHPTTPRHWQNEQRVKVPLAESLEAVLETVLEAASDHENVELGWAEPKGRELPNELNIKITELSAAYRRLQKGEKAGVYITLTNEEGRKKPITMESRVKVQVVTYNGVSLKVKLPKHRADPAEWQKWKTIWVAGTCDVQDLKALTKLVKDSLLTCCAPIRAAIDELSTAGYKIV